MAMVFGIMKLPEAPELSIFSTTDYPVSWATVEINAWIFSVGA
jgi:hypothetical protein